ncbi:MAG: NAD(P)H-hydrate dehydratase [Planctomycetota bacterium]|nr:MAG: NAD(P)H-hydrate dehydratase [Planctomycetota bacterium]
MGDSLQHVTTLPHLPPREADAHKGTFGRVVLVGGTLGMSGAIILAGRAALRSGAGLVYLATPRSILPIVATAESSYLTIALPDDGQGRLLDDALGTLEDILPNKDAVAIGPGLAETEPAARIVRCLFEHCDKPLVLDAGALNLLARCRPWPTAAGPRIITPHPGEFARLTGRPVAEIQADRVGAAAEFARRHGVIVVLKGHGTVITDGIRYAVNQTGNPGLATGGTGDVLTGLTAGLLGQGLEPFAAARLAAHVHGLAGDLAAADRSQPGLIASDLPEYIAAAWTKLEY